MLENLSDQDLIARCLAPDGEQAWDHFVRRYSRLIWSTVHRTCRAASCPLTTEDGEDIYGAIFLSLLENDFQALRQFSSRNACTLSTWLAVIASRKTIDHLRARSCRPLLNAAHDAADVAINLPDSRGNAEQLLIETQNHQKLSSSLEQLPRLDRQLFNALFQRGLSPEEAAREMHLSTAAIYTKKHRLIDKLRKTLSTL